MQFGFRFIIILVPIIILLFYGIQTRKRFSYLLSFPILILIMTIYLFGIGRYIYSNYLQPPEWDFLVFWLNGNVAVSSENFYNPESYQQVVLPYSPSDDFKREIINVGFWYPPTTMFLFLPLGLFTIDKAYLLWQVSSLLICMICIYFVWKLFLKDYGISGLLVVGAMFLVLRPVHSTFIHAQSNFLALLFFLFFWNFRYKEWGGIWLALSVVVKPHMIILYAYLLFAKRWTILAIAVASIFLLMLLSGFVFGADVLTGFFNNPAPNVPAYVYTEDVNQSLLAIILRLTQEPEGSTSPILNPLYLGIAFLLMVITAWLTIKRNSYDGWTLLSILFLALLVYPATLEHYSVFLIIPIVLLLKQSNQSVLAQTIVFFIIFVTYFLVGYESGRYTFFANAFMWLICITMGIGLSIDDITNRMIKSELFVKLNLGRT